MKRGSFLIAAINGMWFVRDTDEFNNWGSKQFLSRISAVSYAEWSHEFKEGRTFREFYDWLDRRNRSAA